MRPTPLLHALDDRSPRLRRTLNRCSGTFRRQIRTEGRQTSRPGAAGLVSERKLLGIQREDRPAFFCRALRLDFPHQRKGYSLSCLHKPVSLSRVLYFPSIDRFPSFILIASPSVIGTTLTLHPQKTDSAGNLKVPLEIKNFS